jgi:hypothetical protein
MMHAALPILAPRSHTHVRLKLLVLGALVSAALCAGCRPALFSQNEPRSQYQRGADLRERSVPPYYQNEFGSMVPNIRGRLLGVE